MKVKDKKKLILIMIGIMILLFTYIVISVLTSILSDKENESTNSNSTDSDKYTYDFSSTLDLEESLSMEEIESKLYTDRPDFGDLGEEYSDADIRYQGNTVVIETQTGNVTMGLEWMNTGLATKIKEPDFGNIENFYLNADDSIKVTYENVKMKDVIGYIKELKNLGFDQVTKDKKNESIYYYAAKNEDGFSVSLNYRKGIFVIGVSN